MDKIYYEAVTQMEKLQVDREYILGWMAGYLQNPKREEQRITAAYETGYIDGIKRSQDNFTQWLKQ